MNEHCDPKALKERFIALRETRNARHDAGRATRARRRTLRPSEREIVLQKTGRRCHICGGETITDWQADHVLAHSGGGLHSVENYLPAHTLCNNYRWDYEPEEFQWVLKIGVWARKQMEGSSALGSEMLRRFAAYENHRIGRRVRR